MRREARQTRGMGVDEEELDTARLDHGKRGARTASISLSCCMRSAVFKGACTSTAAGRPGASAADEDDMGGGSLMADEIET